MPDVPSRPLIAVFNSSDDLVELLRILLENSGFVVVTGHINDLRKGKLDLQSFVTQHKPRAVLYDLIPPYDRQWAFVDHLRQTSPLKEIPFVITSTNAKMAKELAGRSEHVVEVLGRPFEFDQVVAAIRKAIG
jgi:CheY-like chemotaxis protein